MERIIIIDDHLCKTEIAAFLKANKDHIKLSSTMENLKSTTKLFFEELIDGNDEDNKVAIDSEDKISLIRVREVIRIESRSGKSWIFLKKGKPLETGQDIGTLEKKLPVNCFLRIHDDHLINLNYLTSCRFIGKASVQLTRGEVLPLSDDRRDELLKRLEKTQ